MIDINILRADPEKVKNSLKIKNYDLDSDLFIKIDSNRKTLQTEVEDLKGLKNKLSKDFGELKTNNQDTSELSNQLDEIDFPVIGMDTLNLLIKYKLLSLGP